MKFPGTENWWGWVGHRDRLPEGGVGTTSRVLSHHRLKIRNNSHLHLALEVLLICQLPNFCLPDLHRNPSMVLLLRVWRFHCCFRRLTSCLLLPSETSWMSSSLIPSTRWLPVAGVSGRWSMLFRCRRGAGKSGEGEAGPLASGWR